MAAWRLDPADCTVLAVDFQPKFMAGMDRIDAALARSEFLLRVAGLLGVPAIATEQNVQRMGETAPGLVPLIQLIVPKMDFSAWVPQIRDHLESHKRRSVVLTGIETHICMSQTALDLIAAGYRVTLCTDAAAARTQDRHLAGVRRIEAAGAMLVHTEAVAYDWMRSAEHPLFREVLALVKQFA